MWNECEYQKDAKNNDEIDPAVYFEKNWCINLTILNSINLPVLEFVT